jgi:hypothetical protein
VRVEDAFAVAARAADPDPDRRHPTVAALVADRRS